MPFVEGKAAMSRRYLPPAAPFRRWPDSAHGLAASAHGDLQFAYIGPGAGFAFLGSFLSLIA